MLDTTTQLITALKAIFDADTTGDGNLNSLIRAGLRTDRLDVASKKREPLLKGPGDYAKMLIEPRTASETAPVSVFGDNDPAKKIGSGLADRVAPSTQQIAIVFTYSQASAGNLSRQLPCETRVNALLKANWPKLGLSWVAGFTIGQWTRQTGIRETANDANTVDRATMLITFNLRPMLSQLSA